MAPSEASSASSTATREEGSHSDEAKAFRKEELPRIIGRYALLKLLARGGMGEVYMASTTGIEGAERPVVVKVIRREHVSDPSFFARFLDEARVQAQLPGSGVAQVMDAAMDDETGEPYVVIEHVEGRSLGDVRGRLAQVGERLGWAEAVALATMMAEALTHVHERCDASGQALGIVHRDLSPQNVMVSYEGDIKLIDFGTARGANRRCHTVAGVVFAKPGYVAPEVANGNTGDARVDLYALGVILWELAAGRRFLQGDAAEHMAKVAKNQHSLPAVAAAIGAPAELDAIIAKLTAFERDTRYSGARAAASDLGKLLAFAPALERGERSVRARTCDVMRRLFPSEPGRTRKEFARLVADAHVARRAMATPISRAPEGLARLREDEEHGLLPGTRYELLRELGRGASSIVYEAKHVDLGRRVAIKVLAERDLASKGARARFLREAHAVARLSHPALVEVHDYGVTSDDRPYCIMELLDGESLEAMIARRKSIGWREAFDIAERASRVLSVVHAAGIVHRDIKPANLFMTKRGEVKLLDFGIAQIEGEDDGVAPESAPGLALFGTPEYLAPEQVKSSKVDARADIYGLGCVLYEMISGELPFVRASAVALLDAKVKGSPEHLAERAASKGISKPVDALVMRAIARHPSLRFASADELQKALAKALDGAEASRSRRRATGYAVVSAVMVFALVLLAGPKGDFAEPRRAASELGVAFAERVLGPTQVEVEAPVEPTQVEPTQVEPTQVEPTQVGAEPTQVEPTQVEPTQVGAEPTQVEPTQVADRAAAPPVVEAAVEKTAAEPPAKAKRPRTRKPAPSQSAPRTAEKAAKKSKAPAASAKEKDAKRERGKGSKAAKSSKSAAKKSADVVPPAAAPAPARESTEPAAPPAPKTEELEPLPPPAARPSDAGGAGDRATEARRKKRVKSRVAQRL